MEQRNDLLENERITGTNVKVRRDEIRQAAMVRKKEQETQIKRTEARRLEKKRVEAKRAERRSLNKRIITVGVALPLFIFILVSGGNFLVVGVFFLSLIGVFEYTQAVNHLLEPKLSIVLMFFLSIVLLVNIRLDYSLLMPVLLLVFVFIFVCELLTGNIQIQRGSVALMGLVYIPIIFGHLFLFETLAKGSYYMWMIFVIAFSTDTAAYFIGRSIGKSKIAPRISPNKTIAGSVGGVAVAALATVLYGGILSSMFDFNLEWYLYLAVGILGSIAGQCGDLTASMIKRKTQIKDFGWILPGHGGILDRFDSILFIIPFIYIFAKLTVGMA